MQTVKMKEFVGMTSDRFPSPDGVKVCKLLTISRVFADPKNVSVP